MDDLLALFNDETPLEELGVDVVVQQQSDSKSSTSSKRPRGGRNAGCSSISNHDDEQDEEDFDDATTADNSYVGGGSSKRQKPNPQEQLSLSVDVKVDIRMMNRKIAGADLLDLVIENPYFSPASLSAMSLEALNTTILTEPASIVNAATVTGRTNLISVGIVFTNSGTRVSSSSGNAYCAITIGNLYTGPCVSVLLFGPAYSKHCRTLQPGKVVALINPRLIPSSKQQQGGGRSAGRGGKNNSTETSITFTANDERNLLLVGDARDYGTCKAPIRGKNEHGQWVADAKRCRHYVDRRVGDYCSEHRKKHGFKGINNKQGSSTSAMKKLQQEAKEFPTNNNKKITFGNNREMILPQMSRNGGWSSSTMTNHLQLALEPVHNNKQTTTGTTSISSSKPQQLLQRRNNNSILYPPSRSAAPAAVGQNNRLKNNNILNPGAAPATTNKRPKQQQQQQLQHQRSMNGSSLQNNRILNPQQSMQQQQHQHQRATSSAITTSQCLTTATRTTTPTCSISNNKQLQQQQKRGGSGGGGFSLNSLLNPAPSMSQSKQATNPYSQKKRSTVATPVGAPATAARTGVSGANRTAPAPDPPGYSRTSNWLDEATKEKQQQRRSRCDPLSNSSNSHHGKKRDKKERRRSVNTVAVAGFDGSVAVPGPSRIFGPPAAAGGAQPSSSAPAPCTITATTKAPRLPASFKNEEKRRESILSRQREVAQITEEKQRKSLTASKMKKTDRAQVNMSNRKKASSTTTLLEQPSSKRRSFFDSVDDTSIDTEKIAAARSRFANEVEAEEYARSRNRVLTLEKEEESKTKAAEARQKKNNTKQQQLVEGGKECLIEKEWFCITCRKAQKFDPFFCRRSGHNVKVRRTIKENATKGEERQAMSDKGAEDGGLKLGAGLEWSRSWK